MPYSTPTDVRIRAIELTIEVIPDTSADSLNLTTCIAEADAAIDEAAAAGGQTVPFTTVPAWVAHLSAVGALARARRGLQAGNQPSLPDDPYGLEFEAGLARLRGGEAPMGDVVTRADQQETT
jgi:hypothetical protein